jgi:hypothetical protein
MGSDTETKTGYVIVIKNTYHVYADGVGKYYRFNGNVDLWRANKTPVDFYTHLAGIQGKAPYRAITWHGLNNPVDDATGSRNWNINEDANAMANNADFALHAGHGWKDGILFGTPNTDYELFRSNNLSFGGNNGKAKWVAFYSCHVLDQNTQDNWRSVFNGLHILMGFDSEAREGEYQGSQFADRMTGSDIYDNTKIRESWMKTLQSTINKEYIRGAYMWAEPSGEDYFPGFGIFQEPEKNAAGVYDIHGESFNCIIPPD